MDTQTISPPAAAAVESIAGGVDPTTGMVESEFISTLRSILIPKGKKKGPWPPREVLDDPAKVLAQMKAMFGALFDRLELHTDLRRGPTGSAQRIVFDMLAGSDWPNPKDKRFPVPSEYSGKKLALAFRRYEISCAMAIFYRAFHRAGVAGSPTEWPPKN